MPDLKQQLTELIEAFAVARGTSNAVLIKLAVTALVEFLESVQITQQEDDGGQE